MKLSETEIHLAVRRWFKEQEWLLVAGQFPGGSDDECQPLNVVDPSVATDNSPDPRRHSQRKLVPDLVALKNGTIMLLEIKPHFDFDDYLKLCSLLEERSSDLQSALRERGVRLRLEELLDPGRLEIVPGMAFSKGEEHEVDERFAYFEVSSLNEVRVLPAHTGVPVLEQEPPSL